MNTAQKLLVLLSEKNYAAYVEQQLTPTAWWRFQETSGSIAKNSAYTSGIGAELLTNGGFSAWTADNPDGWTIVETPPNSQVTENPAGQAQFVSDGTTLVARQVIATAGNTYRMQTIATARAAGSLSVGWLGGTEDVQTINTATTFANDSIANGTTLQIKRTGVGSDDVTLDSVSVKKIGELDAANTAATVGQAGKLGANEAVDLDGATGVLTVTNRAALANMTTQKWAFLYKQDTVGELSAGKWFNWGNAGAATVHYLGNIATNKIDMTIRAATTAARAVSVQTDSILNNWQWLFADYDDANSLGNGRKIRLFQGLNGAVTQLALGTDTAAVGAVTNQVDNLAIGNSINALVTFDGLMDEVLVKSGSLWTTSEMQTLVDLAGV